MFASHEPRTDVIRTDVIALPSAGLPADHGVASLGLMMQLAGRTTGALAALAASSVLVGVRIPHAPWFWLAIALSFARSQLHRVAGRDLTYSRCASEGVAADPLQATSTYARFGLGHAIAIGLIAGLVFDAPGRAAAGITAALALWPCVLAVICRLPRFGRLRAGLPLGEDRGLEGASILMTVLGVHGVLSTGAVVVMRGALSEYQLQHGWGTMLGAMFAILVVRSVLHVRAGLAGLGDRSLDRPSELAGRYATAGVISAFCVGGMLTLFAMSELLAPEAMAGIAVLCWLLVTWPMIVKRFFHQRLFTELLAGGRAIHRRAPDAGLTGLGWLLAGHVALIAALLIVDLAARPYLGGALGDLVSLVAGRWGSADPAACPALGAVVLALELALAVALIRMSRHRRAIAAIYGLTACAATVALAAPALRAFGQHVQLRTALELLPSAAQLVLPVAAWLLVHRVVVPAAQARYRPSPR